MERETRKEREGMEKTRKDGGFGTWRGFAWLFSVDGIRGLARKLFAVMVAVACAGMLGGCSDDVEFLESGSRKGNGFAMVSDTTALFAVGYYDHYERSSGADWEECTKKGIRLVGTKGIEYNYWEGLVDCSGENYHPYVIHPLGDSTVLFVLSDLNNEFVYYVWKVGQEPIKKMAVWDNYVGRI